MVGTLARLQLTLYLRGLRRSTGAIITTVVMALYGAGALVMLIGGALALRHHPLTQRTDVLVAVMGLLVAIRLFGIFLTGQEQSLDPARFAILPVSARRLQPGLLAASFCTLGPLFLICVVLESVIPFLDRPGLVVLDLLLGALGLVMSTLLCRVLAGALSGVMQARRFRDIAAVVMMVALAISGIGIQAGTRALERSDAVAHASGLASVLGWTPFGWPWAAVADAARGAWLLFGVHLALTLLLCAALWWAWGRLLARQLTSPLEAGGGSGAVRTGTLADRICPQTPAGTLAARTLRYYRRDPRHVMQLIMMMLLPFIMIAPSLFGSDSGSATTVGRGALMLPLFAGLMAGSSTLAQEISLDGSALWMQITAGLSGRSDRWGRLYAFLLVATPLILVVDVVLALMSHQTGRLLITIGASLGGLGASCAVGTVSGALVQTAQPPPGSSPFARGSSGGATAAVTMFAGMFVSAVLIAPFAVSGWLVWNRTGLSWVPMALALVLDPLLLWLACRIGGRILDRSWPEVLKRVTYER